MSQLPPDPLVAQIADELDRALTGPARSLLGYDVAEVVSARVGQAAVTLAAQLRDPDRQMAAQTAIELAPVLPEDLSAEWWTTTPLGQAIAVTYDLPQTVGATDAARILGVHRSRVYQMAAAGELSRSPAGFLLASILEAFHRRS